MTEGFDTIEREPVHFSTLKYMAQSPAHYRHALLEKTPQTEAMRRGSYTHALVLGTSDKWVQYDGIRRGKFWDAFQEEHADKEIITPNEALPCQRMAAAVRRNESAMALLSGVGTLVEQTMRWDFLGRDCEGTPDARAFRYVTDLKTTKCAEPGKFVRDATFRGYHAQLAWYLDGAIAQGAVCSDAYVVAVESTAPYPVTVLKLTDSALEAGRKLCRLWMERLLSCEAANEWPGYVQSVVDFDVAPELELDFGDDDA